MSGPPPCCEDYDGKKCCFPGNETSFVTLKDGTKKGIEDVEVGDMVKVYKGNGAFGYSLVFALGHKNKTRNNMFIELSTASNRITTTPRHFVKICDNGEMDKFAKNVKIGDTLMLDDDGTLKLEHVLEINEVEAQGLYAPFTEEGNIVINGIVASCYAEVKPSLAHKLLSPIRGLSRYLPTSIMDLVMTPNNDGVPMVFDATLNATYPLVAE